MGLNVTVANTGGGTLTQAKGLYTQLLASNSSINTTGYGAHIDSPSVSGGATMPTVFGVRIGNQGSAGVTNATGIRIDAQTGSSNNKALDIGGGDVILSNAVLPLTATTGFTNIPTCAGTPTGTPTLWTGTVPMVFDTTTGRLWIYFGGAWKSSLFN
jgi:hypothetical protein